MTGLGAAFIGRELFATDGSRVGRITAVIHRPRGTDVLVERRHWLVRRQSYRFRLEEIEQCSGGRVRLRSWASAARAFGAGRSEDVAAVGR
jgi:hypothetical protein